MRRASSRQANKYGRALTPAKSISSSDWKLVRISSVSFSNAALLVSRRNVTPERRVAVVSEPPMIRIELFAWILSIVRPCGVRCQRRPSFVRQRAPYPFFSLLEQPLDQIRPFLAQLHPPAQLFLCQFLVDLALFHHPFRNHGEYEFHEKGIMCCRLEHRPKAGKLEDGLDPGVVVGTVETPKAVTPSVSFQRPPKAANSLVSYLSPNAKSPITSNVV
jgi:hypothetical protein